MDQIKQFIHMLMVAVSNCSLYSRNHESLDEFVKQAYKILNDVMDERFEIMTIAGDLVINKNPVKNPGTHGLNLIKRMKRKKITRIDFMQGVTHSELKHLIIDFSDNDKPCKSYPHIKSGVVDIKMKGLAIDETVDLSNLISFNSAQVEKFKATYKSMTSFKKLHIAGLEEVVMNYIVAFKKEANLLKLLSPIKSFSEYTYTHGTNVAILSMAQAEFLGLNEILLYDIGLAALLHDAGKLFISKDILEKEGSLSEAEFQEISQHPLYGARYLTTIERLTPLAPIVALEHHMKFDGTGYPKAGIVRKEQHLCSQIVAIADFFDAMRSNRPYRRSWEVDEVLVLMKKNTEKSFNPVLVDNFIRILNKANINFSRNNGEYTMEIA